MSVFVTTRRLRRGRRARIAAALVLALASLPAGAAGESPAAATALADAEPAATESAGGDELLMFREMPEVISAARRPQPINQLSAPVSVITAEDIHYSGLTSIPDILRFSLGVDVLSLDRTTVAAGVRGLHEQYSDRVLTLIDGRVADNMLYGGPSFNAFPVLIEDIERIEIVRGPAGAVWGANAFSGVINIITKAPADVPGVLASTTWTHFGDSYSQVRWAEVADAWSWKISTGYEDLRSSSEALGPYAPDANDFIRNWRFDARAIYEPSEQETWSFGAAHAHLTEGGAWFAVSGSSNKKQDKTRAFARLDLSGAGGDGYVQWFGNYSLSETPATARLFSCENDLETQVNFELGDAHSVTVGGNIRAVHINEETDSGPGVWVYQDTPRCEYWAGAFAVDRWQATGKTALEGQIRGDWYSEVQSDWSGRFTILQAIDDAHKHVARLSAAKAFRAPLAAISKGEFLYRPLPSPPFPADSYAYNALSADGLLDNEQTWSLEAGYTGEMAKGVTLRVDGFYQRFHRLIGYENLPDPAGMGRLYARPANLGGAESLGVETEAAIVGRAWKLSAWYAFNEFSADEDDQHIRAFAPAPHKAGLTGRLFLPHQCTLNANYRYTDVTPGQYRASMPIDGAAGHRLDFTVGKGFADGAGEVLLGVRDVLNKTVDPTYSVARTSAHETPGRTFFVRVQWTF